MIRNKKPFRVLILLTVLVIAACDRSSNASDSISTPTSTSGQSAPAHWQPSWNTMAEKGKQEKTTLIPVVTFADDGFRGSPLPKNGTEKNQAANYREDFVHTFQNEHDCFGITLTLKDPKAADFALQVFNGIDGRTGSLQWVLYRTDTLRASSWGESTGAGTKMGMDGVVHSVCTSVHNSISSQGGRVEVGK